MGAQLTLVDEACMCHVRRDARMNLYFELPPRPAHLQRRLCDLVRPIERRVRVARLFRSVEGRERQHLLSQYTLLQVGRQALEQVIADASTVCGCASVSELQKDVGSGEQAEEALAVELDCGRGRDGWFPVYRVEVRKRGQLVSENIIYSPKRGVDAYRAFLYSTSTSAVQEPTRSSSFSLMSLMKNHRIPRSIGQSRTDSAPLRLRTSSRPDNRPW